MHNDENQGGNRRKMDTLLTWEGKYCRAGVVFSIQNWLGESAETKKNGTPGYFNIGLSGTSTASVPSFSGC